MKAFERGLNTLYPTVERSFPYATEGVLGVLTGLRRAVNAVTGLVLHGISLYYLPLALQVAGSLSRDASADDDPRPPAAYTDSRVTWSMNERATSNASARVDAFALMSSSSLGRRATGSRSSRTT